MGSKDLCLKKWPNPSEVLTNKKQRKMRLRDANNIIKPIWALTRRNAFYFNIKPEEPPKNSKTSHVFYLGLNLPVFFQNIWNLSGDPVPVRCRFCFFNCFSMNHIYSTVYVQGVQAAVKAGQPPAASGGGRTGYPAAPCWPQVHCKKRDEKIANLFCSVGLSSYT